MFGKRNGARVLAIALVAALLLGIPMVTAAETANGITSPTDGATVSGQVEVKGYAGDANFSKWQLDLLPGGNADAAIFLALGETAGDVSYTLDTANLPDGEHAFRLRVVRSDSNYDEFVSKFTIDNVEEAAAPAEAEAAAPAEAAEAAPAEAAEAAPAAEAAAPVAAETAPAAEPVNGFTAPKDGATISGKVDVEGYANDANFAKWQLDLLPGGNADAAIFLALGETAGDFSYALDTANLPAGEHAFRLRVVRSDSNYDEYVSKFTIAGAEPVAAAPTEAAAPVAAEAAAPAAAEAAAPAETAEAAAPVAAEAAAPEAAAPVNGFTAPEDGATISGEVDVEGYANDANFVKWQLDLLPGGNADAAIFLALGETAGDFSYALDTANLPAGEHAFRLRVVRSDGNYSEYVSKFTIAGAEAAAE